MKKLMILAMLFSLVSCGDKPSETTESTKRAEIETSYADMVISIDDLDNVSFNPGLVKIWAKESTSETQVLLLVNLAQTPKTFTLDTIGLSSRYQINPIDCTLPVTLDYRRKCFVSLELTAPEITATEEDFSDSFTINGNTVSIDTKVLNVNTPSEFFSLGEIFLSKSNITATLNKSDTYSTAIIIKNTSNDVFSNFSLALESEVNQGGVFSLNNNCPTDLARGKSCVMTLSFDSTLATENTVATADVNIAGGASILPISLTINNDPAQQNYLDVFDVPGINNYTFNVNNESRTYDNTLSYDLGTNLTLEYPSMFSINDGCSSGTVAAATSCIIRLDYDTDRFHNGISFSKDITINGETFNLNLVGTSPCPDGQLLDQTDTCVPNLGVFDSADSLFGFAVFQ